jgi:hypothetical protein
MREVSANLVEKFMKLRGELMPKIDLKYSR